MVERFGFHLIFKKEMTQKRILLLAIGFIAVAIVFGAFGAHALKERIAAEKLVSFETGVRYQMYHGLALLTLASFTEKWTFSNRLPVNLIILGTLLFSFSIYGLALQEVFGMSLKFLGPITPIGGSVLIIGWILLGFKIFKSQ
jgi:uncharacterized membrane protein YgdD (TMEM256/DUF423 family)